MAGVLCLLTASVAFAPHAFAQQATSDTAPLQEVTVTGSRIKRTTDYTSTTPTTVTDAATMESLGVVNVGQMLEMTPSNISAYTPQTTGNGSFYTGAYIADLRGFNGFFSGARTLTMIDGHRVVSTNTQDSFDLNFIPQVLVQRIDTVTGGASAAYGSGAESGVLNIILDRQLEGGKFNADFGETNYNDDKDKHVAAAYGHGLFDNRVHFVLGAEYEHTDPASCQFSDRAWCNSNTGPYSVGTTGIAQPSAGFYTGSTTRVGSHLTDGDQSLTGVIAPGAFSFATFSTIPTVGAPLYQASPDGLSIVPFTANSSVVGGLTSAPGGSGLPVNQYTNLVTATSRAIFTAMLTGKITDSINASVDLNWGKVRAFNPGSEVGQSYVLGADNPFIPASVLTTEPLGPGQPGYFVGKDFTSQIPNNQFNNTTLKRVSVGLDGKIGDTSWTWDAHGEYGESFNVEGIPQLFTVTEAAMAVDTVKGPNGQPECRVTRDGGLVGALASATTTYGAFSLPSYLNTANTLLNNIGSLPTNPVDGLSALQNLTVLAQNCVPLNVLGSNPLQPGASNYVTGQLTLTLFTEQKDFALNTSGEIWKGMGAGAWSLAAGYEWRSELLHNDFTSCPGGLQQNTAAQQLCLARTTDFAIQFGNAYGGSVTANEVYLELNAPILKDIKFAHMLDIDLAARESRYTNNEEYAVGLTPGATSSYNLPTWKASILYEPFESLRFRATQSRDSRAPNPRDLYYSQTFVPGSFFGTCGGNNNPNQTTPCYISLTGNLNLKPETTNTTTVGMIFSPTFLRGFQASADFFHIHLTNGINGGGFTSQPGCYAGGPASAYYCSQITFNNYSYNAAGQYCNNLSVGIPGTLSPQGGNSANCTGQSVKTGVAAYQQPVGAANIVAVNNNAYNGAFYDEHGVDFSVSYTASLPGGSTLSTRALATWVGKQEYQNNSSSAVLNLLGQNSASGTFLPDYTNAARWRGNMSVTWALGGFSLTPNMSFVGPGTIGNYSVEFNPAAPSVLATEVLTGYAAAKNPSRTPAQLANDQLHGYALLPAGVANRVPAYFEFGLNAAYNFTSIPGTKGLQLYTQVNNLFNKTPPFTNSTTSYPIFYDQLGLAYRVGFRLTF
jgi:outer membrane receptor protein involved in Fe transport